MEAGVGGEGQQQSPGENGDSLGGRSRKDDCIHLGGNVKVCQGLMLG